MVTAGEGAALVKSWLEWAQENLARNCDAGGIAQILLANGFSLAEAREMMGERFPEGLARNAADELLDRERLHQKREALVVIQRSLARLAPRSRAVERRNRVTRAEFLERYYAENRPVVLCDLMHGWQAPRKWTAEYLKAVCGTEVVEVMAARETNPTYEIEDAGHRRNVLFSDFVDAAMADRETNDYYLTARNDFFRRPGVRPLLQDIVQFPEYLRSDDNGSGAFLWFGPKGTVTPLHHDLMNIFMAQVKGRKQVKLVPPEELDLIYNHHAVYSLVDCGNPDYQQVPKFSEATVIDLVLAPGEVLFLPVGWWHYVKALDTSITVSFNNFLFPNEFEWVHPKRRS